MSVKHDVSASYWLDCDTCDSHLQNGDADAIAEWLAEHGGLVSSVYGKPVPGAAIRAEGWLVESAETHAARELLLMAQVESLVDAVATWDAERMGMREMQAENNDLRLTARRLNAIIPSMLRYLDMVEKTGALFLPPTAAKLAADIRDQVAKLKVPLTISKEIVEHVE